MSELDYARECDTEPEPAEDERVKEIRERRQKIVGFPWSVSSKTVVVGTVAGPIATTYNTASTQEQADRNLAIAKPNAEFIAHAPGDIDYLLSLLPVQPAQQKCLPNDLGRCPIHGAIHNRPAASTPTEQQQMRIIAREIAIEVGRYLILGGISDAAVDDVAHNIILPRIVAAASTEAQDE